MGARLEDQKLSQHVSCRQRQCKTWRHVWHTAAEHRQLSITIMQRDCRPPVLHSAIHQTASVVALSTGYPAAADSHCSLAVRHLAALAKVERCCKSLPKLTAALCVTWGCSSAKLTCRYCHFVPKLTGAAEGTTEDVQHRQVVFVDERASPCSTSSEAIPYLGLMLAHVMMAASTCRCPQSCEHCKHM